MEGNGTQQYVSLSGTVVGVVFHNAENGYTVLRVSTPEGTVTAVGCFPGIACGEEVVMEGTVVAHPSYGQQFKAERVQRRMPGNRREIYEYLAFGAVKGIGPGTAAAIVTKFGDQTLEVMENEPEKLAEVKGISPRRALAIGAEFRRSTGLRRLMEFLSSAGLKPQLAIKLYRAYGEEAMDAVKDNPYILTHEYFGADFFEADALAETLGFEDDCPQRMEAAVLFELRHNLTNGHVFLPESKLIAAVRQLIGAEEEPAAEAVAMLAESGYIIREEIAGLTAVYLERLHYAETYVARRITEMARNPVPAAEQTDRLIDEIGERLGIRYAGRQREAIRTAAVSRVMALTGGPGTGKTTSVRGILAMMDKLALDCVLAAPTGRAAKRMSELTGREAFTIHRLLGAGYGGEGDELVFEHDAENPIDAGVVILDESSMIDITLMTALLEAIQSDCRLILVGDTDQLPSVGPGNVFSDIIRSGVVPVVRLTEIFRQAKESHIVRNAHLINQGLVPDLSENKGDFFFLGRSSEERTVDTIVELCARRLPGRLGIDPADIQVLSPGRRRPSGTIQLNRRLQEALNPPAEGKNEKEYGEFLFREGDRVMQIRNNYDIMWKKTEGETVLSGTGIFNGDIGRIVSIDKSREIMTIDYEDKVAAYPFEMLYEIEPAYAMTVHKAQGSEYRTVVLAAFGGAPALQTRGVLYTAVTRAREMLVIVGDSGTIAKMTQDDRRQRRYSGLKIRLTEGKTQ